MKLGKLLKGVLKLAKDNPELALGVGAVVAKKLGPKAPGILKKAAPIVKAVVKGAR